MARARIPELAGPQSKRNIGVLRTHRIASLGIRAVKIGDAPGHSSKRVDAIESSVTFRPRISSLRTLVACGRVGGALLHPAGQRGPGARTRRRTVSRRAALGPRPLPRALCQQSDAGHAPHCLLPASLTWRPSTRQAGSGFTKATLPAFMPTAFLLKKKKKKKKKRS